MIPPGSNVGAADKVIYLPKMPEHLAGGSGGPLAYKSFSGVDIKVGIMMDQQQNEYSAESGPDMPFSMFAELQTLSITSFRSTGPVRCLGESQPRAILRGARTIGGSLVFAQFDQNAFWRMMRLSDKGEVYNQDEPFFIDQLPPFDIIAYGSNEYGNTATLFVGGVTIGQTGTTLSVHDIYTEATYSYIAQYYIPWSPSGSFRDYMREIWWEQNFAASLQAGKFADSLKAAESGAVVAESPESWLTERLFDEGYA